MNESTLRFLKKKNILILNQRRITSLERIQGNNIDESFKWSEIFNNVYFLCFSETEHFLYRKNKNHVIFTIPFKMYPSLIKTLFSLLRAQFFLLYYCLKLIKIQNIHLLRPENTVLIGLPALLLGKFTNTPVVNWYIGHERNALKAKFKQNPISKLLVGVIYIIEKIVLNSACCVITLSKELIQISKKHGVKNLIFSPNSLDIAKFDERDYSHLNEPKINFNLLFSGRLDPEKNLDIILKAIEWIARKRRNFKIKIVGDGIMMDWINNYINNHNLESQVILLGYMDYYLMPELYRESDIFLLPSQQIEGMSASLMEAMCSGCACIVTPVGHHQELIRQDDTGLLVQEGNVLDLSNSIKFLLDNPQKIKLYGINARKLIINLSKNFYNIHGFVYKKVIEAQKY